MGRLIAALLCGYVTAAGAQSFAIDEYYHSTHRMGAFQCIRCPKGGFLEGIRYPDHGRTLNQFSALQALCVANYRLNDGEEYVYFKLDGDLWPDRGRAGFKVNSWNAECYLK